MSKKVTLESKNNTLSIMLSIAITYSIIVTALFFYYNYELQQTKGELNSLSLSYDLLLQKSKE